MPRRVVRYSIVGAINTAVDMFAFLLMGSAGVPVIAATLSSTTIGLLTSFTLHRHFTFGASPRSRSQKLTFAMVTLTGLWLFQPAIVWVIHTVFTGLANELLVLIGAKAIATAVTMAWNYWWYSRTVFIPPPGRQTFVATRPSRLHGG